MNIIELQQVKKSYLMGAELIHALAGVDLEVKENEYLALMGPSGSGKSTLMNILGCLDVPSNGAYLLNNVAVEKMTDDELAHVRNKEIGFVFQTFNLLPRLSALENVMLPLIYAGISKNLELGNTESNYFGINYDSDCLQAGLTFSKKFYQNQDVQYNKALAFFVTLKPFGQPFAPDLKNLIN